MRPLASWLALILTVAGSSPLLAQSDLPIAAEVLILPGEGDIATVNPVVPAVRYSIGPTELCGFLATPDPPLPVINPTALDFGDPFHQDANGTLSHQCVVPIPPGIPAGENYRATALLIYQGFEGETRSPRMLARYSFSIRPAMDPCAGAVVFDLGQWSRTVPVGGKAWVTFYLGRSAMPITRLRYLADAKESGNPLSGDDLRSVGSAYFDMPLKPGRYTLNVVAIAGACTGGADRPATVEVLP